MSCKSVDVGIELSPQESCPKIIDDLEMAIDAGSDSKLVIRHVKDDQAIEKEAIDLEKLVSQEEHKEGDANDVNEEKKENLDNLIDEEKSIYRELVYRLNTVLSNHSWVNRTYDFMI